MKAVILAAGKSKRMNSSSSKLLFDLLGKPVISNVIENVKRAGIDDIIIVVGAYRDEVLKTVNGYGVSHVVQDKQKGTADAVKRALPHLGDDGVIVLCGDTPLLTSETIGKMVEYYRSGDTDLVILTSFLENPGSYGRILRDTDGKIVRIIEYKDASESIRKIKEVNVGVYVGDASLFRTYLPKIKPSRITGEYYLTDIVWELYKDGKSTGGIVLKDNREMLGVNTREDLVEVSRVLKDRVIKKHLKNGVTIKDPVNTYIEVDVEIGRDTIINPFTYLEGKTRIGERCVIGPFVWLKDEIVEDGGRRVWHGLKG